MVEEKDYTIECFNCGYSLVDLAMYPHRRNKRIVGWIFLCPCCKDTISGKEMIFTVKEATK
jgi:hypothetical protein